MDNAVTNRVCQNRIGELLCPARNVKLGTQNRRSPLVPGLHNFQKVSGFRFLQGVEKPFINNQERVLLVLGQKLSDASVASGNVKLHQQIRQTDVLDCQELSDCRHSQRTCQIGLAAPCRSQQDDVVALLNVIAGAKPQQFLPLQISVWKIFHIFQTGAGVGEGGLADQFLQMVILTGMDKVKYTSLEDLPLIMDFIPPSSVQKWKMRPKLGRIVWASMGSNIHLIPARIAGLPGHAVRQPDNNAQW